MQVRMPVIRFDLCHYYYVAHYTYIVVSYTYYTPCRRRRRYTSTAQKARQEIRRIFGALLGNLYFVHV